MTGELAQRLAAAAGIAPSFHDYFGNETIVGEDCKRALLTAMGFDLSSRESAENALRELETPRELPPTIAVTAGSGSSGLRALTTLRDAGRAEIRLENGAPFAGQPAELPLGYHRFEAANGESGALIVAPDRCYLAPEMREGRIWALATQLYALRSKRNWGIGDFSDLAALCEQTGRAGAAAVALNPLHDLHRCEPAKCSPYSPTSRRWLNTLYLDVERVPDFSESSEARDLVAALGARLEALRAAPTIDYPGVAAAKRLVLEPLWHSFRTRHLERPGDPRAVEFRAFVRAGGRSLENLARYEALTAFFHDRDLQSYGWLQWPDAYRCAGSSEVERFARDQRDAVDLALYLQWLAHDQLSRAARSAHAHGVGLYCDLAVGADRNSADAWSDPRTVLPDVSLGAPPDALNALGQNWGLPPLSPYALRRQGYAPFAQLLRANMRYASILRIDHVMALQRTFWIPMGRTPREGAYVEYPVSEMLAVVALESVRNRCTVVGEDLGTVPPGFRERMTAAGALSSRVLYFERNWNDGTFAAPEQYPRLAAASVGTHDLPPLAGWWTGDDLRRRQDVGLLADAAAESARDARRGERYALIYALEREGALAPADAAALRIDAAAGGTLGRYGDLRGAVYRFLAKTPSVLAIASMEDVLGDENAVNVPGTLDEHPNWRRKHCRSLEELERDGTLDTIGALLRERSLT